MGKSKAKKFREKLQREGKLNPELSRSPFVFEDMRTRKTKTKKDVLYRTKHKNQFSKDGRDGSFYFGKLKFLMRKIKSDLVQITLGKVLILKRISI